MPAAPDTTEVQALTLTMNGQEVKALPGQTILEVARDAGIDIPTLCHDPRLEPYGACRMCLVEVEGARGPMAACGTTVREGMKIETHTEKIRKLRKFVLELLLTNHPLDCPVCEAAGDCRLQDYAYEYQVNMVPWGWRPPSMDDPGAHPNVAHYKARCILCGRCVRICREIMSIGCWGYVNRGYDSEVDTPYRLPLQEVGCVSCGQCVSTCPVGAIVGQRTPEGAREWQTTKTTTTCSYCSNGCSLLVYSYRNKVVRVSAELEKGLNKGNLCIKGRFGIGFVNAPDRLTSPLVRNAAGELEQSSWAEALTKVADKAAAVRDAGGGTSLGFVAGTHLTNEAAYLLQKLARTLLESPNVDSVDHPERAAAEQILNATLGLAAFTNSRRDLDKADVILVVGSNLTESDPVLALDVIRAIRCDKTVIVLDPRTTDLARRAKIHLPVKPGTDLAVLRAMMRHILNLELEDASFIDARTQGFAEFRQSLDGVDIAAVADLAGVGCELLKQAAAAYGQAPAAAVFFGSGVGRGRSAESTVQGLASLAMLTGNLGRPGTGLYPLLSGANSQGLIDMGLRPDRLPGFGADEVQRMRAETAWGTALPAVSEGKSVDQMFDAIESGDLRFLYVAGADPALALVDEGRIRKALAKIDFLVVEDSFLSDTATYADVVLPAAVATEDEGTFTNSERFVQLVRPVVPIVAGSLPDWQILQAVANRLGGDWAFSTPADVMREISEIVPEYAGINYDKLADEGLQWPCANGNAEGTPILFSDASTAGRAVFEPLSPGARQGAPDSVLPFVLLTGSVREHHGTGVRSRRAAGITALLNDARMEISPADAAALGLEDGNGARVSNAAGTSIDVVAWITDRVGKGMIFLPKFCPTASATRLLTRDSGATPRVKVEKIG